MKKCAIIDDSGVIRKLIRNIIESFGQFDCVEYENGQVALDGCKADFPYLIIVDWNMPVMNGLDFVKNLRALPNGSEPIIIFCTTENDMTRITQAISAGANEYIMKPFDEGILKDKLEQTGAM